MNSQTVPVKPANSNVKPMNTNVKPAAPATSWLTSLFGSPKPKPVNATTVGGRRKMRKTTMRKNRNKTRKNRNRKNKNTRKH